MESDGKNTVFLTYDEALAAVRVDLRQYGPQPILLRSLARLILGERMLADDSRKRGLWVKEANKRNPVLVTFDELPDSLCKELERKKLPLETLVAICGCVFQERARTGRRDSDGVEGVVVETGVEKFECRQCGRCCRVLDYHGELTREDREVWEKLGRTDILERVMAIRQGDGSFAHRIWMDPVTREIEDGCPWLKKDSENNRCICLIHDVRPAICRQYPGSRKHARMTGCPGFESKTRKP